MSEGKQVGLEYPRPGGCKGRPGAIARSEKTKIAPDVRLNTIIGPSLARGRGSQLGSNRSPIKPTRA